MANNIYGVQKVKEPEVRDGLDVASATAGAAAQGAKLGANFGPYGAAAGGLIAGGYALTQQKKMQRLEKQALGNAKLKNEFTDNLEGRSLREDTMVSAQARYGMNPNKRYETAEIEGDGSGSASGIGEIHVDKNYNIKNIARGSERHEDGGFEIKNLEKEDIIFPTQDNEEEFNKVLGAINKWKLKRDPRAKKLLDRTRDRLPTDEDYGYDKKYPEGKGKAYGEYITKTNLEAKRKAFEKKFPNINYDEFLKDNEKKIIDSSKTGKDFEQFADEMLSNSNQGETVDQMQNRVDSPTSQDYLKALGMDDVSKKQLGDEMGEEMANIRTSTKVPSGGSKTKGMTDAQIEELAYGIENAEKKGGFQGQALSIAKFTANNPYLPGKVKTHEDLVNLLKNHYIPDMKKNLGEENFNKLDTDILKELTDWNFNSGRSASDVLAYAGGDITLDKWNGAGKNPVPENLENITLDDIVAAKHDGYKTDGVDPNTNERYTLENPNPTYEKSFKGRIGNTQNQETYKKVTDTYNGVRPDGFLDPNNVQDAKDIQAMVEAKQRYKLNKTGTLPSIQNVSNQSDTPPEVNQTAEVTGGPNQNPDGTYNFGPPVDENGNEIKMSPVEDSPNSSQSGEGLQKVEQSSNEEGDYEEYQKRVKAVEKGEEVSDGQKTWDEITKMEKYNNPGKYASMINKSIQGSKPIEGVERRFSNSEKYKYEDMSAKDRQTNVEQRNYQNLSMRGKGLTAGQIQSYGAQNNAQYYGNSEGINQRENKKRYEISNANVELTNKDKQANTALANQYDAIERQQRGVQQRYKDASYSDFSKFAQLDEQKQYMMNKDRKMFLRDKATLPYLGTNKFGVTPDGVKYKSDGTTDETTSTKQSKGKDVLIGGVLYTKDADGVYHAK